MSEADAFRCPVDGCDYGEGGGKSLAAVRAHVNASGEDGHSWEDVDPVAVDGAEETEDSDTSEDSEESDAEQDETNESDQQDEEEDDPDDMATDEEYQAQHSDDDTDQGDTDSDTDQAAAAGAAAGGAGLIAWMGEGNRMVLLGGILLALVLVLLLTGDSSDTTDTSGNEAVEQADAGENDKLPGASEGGGLRE